MVDKTLKIYLSEKQSKLDFKSLVSLMDESEIEFRINELKGPIGLATTYCIYLDFKRLIGIHEKMFYFIILHEIAHHKRITKLGKDKIMESLSIEDFDTFCEFIINEEIIADRYGCFLYYKLNKELFPKAATQELENNDNKIRYKKLAIHLFGVVKNNEENYKELMESFVV